MQHLFSVVSPQSRIILQLIVSKYNVQYSYFDDSAHCIIANVARHVVQPTESTYSNSAKY